MRTVEARPRAAAEDGDRRAQRSRRLRREARRPSGAVVQVFRFGGGRVIERFELQIGRRRRERRRRARGASSRPRCSSSTTEQVPPPEIHVPVADRRRDVLESVAVGAGRAQGPHRRAAARRQEGHGRAGAAQRGARLSRALRHGGRRRTTTRSSCCKRRSEAAGAAAPDRVLRHLDDPGQRDRRVDGRVRGRPDEEGRLSQVPRRGDRGSRNRGRACRDSRRRLSRSRPRVAERPVPRRLRGDEAGRAAAATRECSRTAGRFRT